MNKRISSFTEYWKAVKKIPCQEDEMLIFRGQSNAKYILQPSVFRNTAKDYERTQYHEIMIECPEEFPKREHLSNLVKMQHYGIETRLLDFSRNPLVGLLFASEADKDIDGKVAVCQIKKSDILYHTSDKILMLSCLPCFSDKDKEDIKTFCENHRGEISEQMLADSDAMRRFLHEIRGEYPAFECAIVGQHLLNTYFVSPRKDNERMKIQDGIFALFGLKDKQLDKIPCVKIHEIFIDAHAKPKLLEDLELLGISNAKLYSGLERRAMELHRKRTDWVCIDTLGEK